MQYAGSQYTGAGYAGQQPGYGYTGQYQQQPQPPQPMQHQFSGQQQQQYGSTPYNAPVPFPSPHYAPSTLQPVIPQQPTHRPAREQTPHPSMSRRRVSSSTRPVRSAMKDRDRDRDRDRERDRDRDRERTRTTSANGPLLSVPTPRTRRTSGGPETRPRVNSMARTRTNSSSRSDPGTRPPHISPPVMPLMITLFSDYFKIFLMRFIKTTFFCR